MALDDRRLAWVAILTGVGVELVAVAVGLLLPLSSGGEVRTFLALALLNVGLLGGAVTGLLLDGSWRSNARHGLVTGAIGGGAFAVALYLTVTNAVPVARNTGFWKIHFVVATEVPTPSWMVVRYGQFVVAGIALLVATFVALEAAVAAAAVTSAVEPDGAEG